MIRNFIAASANLLRGYLPPELLRVKTATRDFLIYATGNLFSGGMSFLLVPVYTRVLERSQYGAFDLVAVSMSLVGSFLTLGLNQLIGVRYFQVTGHRRNQVIGNLLTIYALIATPITIPILLLSDHIAASLFGAEVTGQVILVAALAAYMSFFDSVGFSLLQQEKRAALYAALSIIKAALILGTSILLVVIIPLGVLGVLLGILAGKIVGMALLGWNWIWNYRQGVEIHLSGLLTGIRETLWTSLPLMLSSVLLYSMVAADRYVIRALLGTAPLGAYSVSAKMAQAFEVLMVLIVAKVYGPRILDYFRRAGKEKADRLNTRISILYFFSALAVGAVMFGGLWIAFPWLVGADYQESLRYIPYLIGAKIMMGMRNFAGYYLLFSDATRRIMLAYVFGIVAIIAFDLIMIPSMGLEGAALATMLASGLVFVATYLLKRSRRARDAVAAAGSVES